MTSRSYHAGTAARFIGRSRLPIEHSVDDAALLEQGWNDAAEGREELALAAAAAVASRAAAVGDAHLGGVAALVATLACTNSGRFEEGRAHVDRLTQLVEQAPDPLLAGYGWVLRAFLALSRSDIDEALEHVVRAEAAAVEIIDRPDDHVVDRADKRARLLSNIVATYSTSEHYEDADRVIALLLESNRGTGEGRDMHLFRRGRNLVLWAMRHEHCGQHEEAAVLFDRGAAAYAEALEKMPADRFLAERSVGHSARALAVARAALLRGVRPDLSGCAPGKPLGAEATTWALYAQASVALAAGDPAATLRLIDEAGQLETATVLGVPQGEAGYLRALAYAAIGDTAAALDAYRELHHEDSRRAYEQRRQRLDSARARMERAELALAAHRYAAESLTDALTGLPNRRHLDSVLAALDGRPERLALTIAALDLDRFKEINDSYGHLVGDGVLQRVAHRLRDTLRQGDMVARYGGDEFVVVAAGLPAGGADGLCDRLVEAVAQAEWGDLLPAGVRPSISCGMATATEAESPRDVLGRADAALIAHKTARRYSAERH